MKNQRILGSQKGKFKKRTPLFCFFNKFHIKNYVALILSLFIFLSIVIFDYLVIGTKSLYNPQPNFSRVYLFRSLMIFISALLLIVSVTRWRSTVEAQGGIKQDLKPYMTFDFGKLGSLSFCAPLLLWGTLLLSACLLLLFVLNPGFFSTLSTEDHLIEMLSALCLFLSCGYFIFLSLQIRQMKIKSKIFCLTVSLLFSMTFFVVGMEEVSWFQRSLTVATPGLFSANDQGEMNLHNFATTEVEIIYYFSAFLLLILIPFVHDQTFLLSRHKHLSIFVPSCVILFVSAPLAAFNYNMWNCSTTQFSFFVTLFILVYYTYLSYKGRINRLFGRYYLSVLMIMYIMTQVVFLSGGDKFIREWDVTEYKEFLIPLSFSIYSLEIVMRRKQVISLGLVRLTFTIGLLLLLFRIFPKMNV